jgi:putative sigma-54 modulation protein
MDILIQADGVTLTEPLKTAIEEKIGRIEHYAPRALRARVRLRKVSAHPSPRQYVVRVLCELPGEDISAEESNADAVAALELVSDKLERRLRRRKTQRLARRQTSPRAEEKGRK